MKSKAGILLYRTRGNSLEILLVRNSRGNWSIPKGRVEEGESRLKAARRELEEEANISAPKTLSYLCRVTDEKREAFLCCYVGRAPRYARPKPGREIVEAKFVSLEIAFSLINSTQQEVLRMLEADLSSVA